MAWVPMRTLPLTNHASTTKNNFKQSVAGSFINANQYKQ